MSRGLNRIIMIGNLGADPEIKYTASGTAIANFNIAINEKRKKDGEWQDHTEWVPVTLFGKTAETAKDYLRKGSCVYIEGRWQTRSWEDQSGDRKYRTEVIANQMIMLDGSGGKGGSGGSKRDEAPPYGDDDLPF